jgi:hypothetical protein
MEYVVLDHARKFLSVVLPDITPEHPAHYNIHWSFTGQNGKKFWDGRACATIDEAIKTIAWASKGEPKDIYVCMSTQRLLEEKTSKKGFAYKKAVRSAADAVLIQSLFADIDVKPDAYADTREALIALRAFITDIGLPNPSAVVASGSGGFHAHWALDQALQRDEWQVLANSLSTALTAQGIKCDTQCTVDSARILRVPETLNHKTDVPREVKLLSIGSRVSTDDVRTALAKYSKPTPVKNVLPIKDNDELGSGVESKARPIIIDDVAKSCGFIKRSLETGGADNPNPLWFLTASIASFTEDGREALHQMSNGHAGYTPEATDELYDRVTAKRKERDVGWPQCDKIAGYGCKECTTCPLFSNKKSPLNYATPSIASVPDNTMPDGYFRNSNGFIFRRVIDETGATLSIQISMYPMWDAWLSNNPWTLHFTTKTDTGPKTKMEIPTEVITAKDALAKYLGGKGIFVGEKGAKLFKEFLLSWIQKLQNTKDAVISSSPFGWSVVDGNIEGFSFGGRVWMDNEDRPAINPDPNLAYQYTPKGDTSSWYQLAKIITDQRRPGLDIIIASAFAAPLVRFTGHQGLMVNAYSSESGIGKTTAMKVAQAVWGDPIRAMQGLNDTVNSVLKKVGDIRNLPLLWDELKTDTQTAKFVSMAFDITGGREKSRLNADSTLKSSGVWQTMVVSASNDSIVDDMIRVNKSTTAGVYRTFEYTVTPGSNGGDHVLVNHLLGKLNDNFGHIGLTYAKFLGSKHKKIAQDMADFGHDLWSKYQFHNEERFWYATIVTLVMGARYANELGFTDIDLVTLENFLATEVLPKMRDEIKATPDATKDIAVSTILAQFLSAMRGRNTLITNRILITKGKPPKGFINILNDTSKLSEIMVQIGRDDRLVRISSTAFSAWMSERGYSRMAFTKKMKDEFGLKDVHGKLGGGTEMVSAVEYLLEIDLNDHKLKEFVG